MSYEKEKKILGKLVNSKDKRILVSERDNKILCENIKPDIEVDGKKYKILSVNKKDKYLLSLKKV